MRVTAEGQITIPLDVQNRTGIGPGTEVEFVEEKDRVYLKVVNRSERINEVIQRMTGAGDVQMTTDEILALTRGDD